MFDFKDVSYNFLEGDFENRFELQILILLLDIYKLSDDHITELCNIIGLTYSEILEMEYKDIFNLVDQLSKPEQNQLKRLAKKYALERV